MINVDSVDSDGPSDSEDDEIRKYMEVNSKSYDDSFSMPIISTKSEKHFTEPNIIKRVLKLFDVYFWKKKSEKDDGLELMKETNKRPLSEEMWFLPDGNNVFNKLHKTAQTLKKITNSAGYVLYVVSETMDHLFICPKNWDMFYDCRLSWKIRFGKTIATYVAKSKEGLIVDTTHVDPRFPRGQELGDLYNTDIIAVPILDFEGTCIGVLELYRENEVPYEKGHLNFLSFMLKWVGETIQRNKRGIVYESLLNAVKYMENEMFESSAHENVARTIYYKALVTCKNYTHAESVSLFLLENGKTVKEACTNDLIKVDKKVEKLMLDKEILLANLTLQSGWMVNMSDVYNDNRFDHEPDIQSGHIIRTVLQASLTGRKRNHIGVLQVINKLNGGDSFSSVDELMSVVCANSCGLWYNFKTLWKAITYQMNMSKELQGLLYFLITKRLLQPETYYINNTKSLPRFLQSYSYGDDSSYILEMPKLTFTMINNVCNVGFDSYDLYNFIYMVKRCYRREPFYNSSIFFKCTHFMFLLLYSYPNIFDMNEKIALMISIMSAGMDRKGHSLKRLKRNGDPLLALYIDCPYERHSIRIVKMLIEMSEIFKNINQEDREVILEMIEENILATNYRRYIESRTQTAAIIAKNAFDWSNSKHRRLLRSTVMMAAKISVLAKPFPFFNQILSKYMEQLLQDDKLDMELKIKESKERKKELLLILSKCFELVNIPCYEIIRTFFPSTELLYRGTIDNYRWMLDLYYGNSIQPTLEKN